MHLATGACHHGESDTKMPTTAKLSQILLLSAAVGLAPVALSYGLAPERSLPWLFGIDASGVNSRHIFRAVMGLYLASLCFWILGAAVGRFRVPALWSLFVFMSGLALGRISSLMLDGWPHPLLVVYTAIELVVASVALWVLGMGTKRPHTE
jgi:hypothetical protein